MGEFDHYMLMDLPIATFHNAVLDGVAADAAAHDRFDAWMHRLECSSVPIALALLREVSQLVDCAGRLAMQDEASQLVALLVGKGSNILDCCAAPGGKTRLLAERNPEARITAVELHPLRARLLRKLVPAKNVEVIQADVRELKEGEYDRVLVDVPCSGTGTLARNPEIKWRLNPEDLVDLHGRQLQILRSALRRLKPGGRLVYSTCSLEQEENAEVVEEALADDPSIQLIECRSELERLRADGDLAWTDIDSLTAGPCLRTIPGTHPCDGFFAAIVERRR